MDHEVLTAFAYVVTLASLVTTSLSPAKYLAMNNLNPKLILRKWKRLVFYETKAKTTHFGTEQGTCQKSKSRRFEQFYHRRIRAHIQNNSLIPLKKNGFQHENQQIEATWTENSKAGTKCQIEYMAILCCSQTINSRFLMASETSIKKLYIITNTR